MFWVISVNENKTGVFELPVKTKIGFSAVLKVCCRVYFLNPTRFVCYLTVTIQPSGFVAKKQAIFRQTSLLFAGDAAHRLKKEAQDGGKATFFAQNASGLDRYITLMQV
jgi:hypothetical protein